MKKLITFITISIFILGFSFASTPLSNTKANRKLSLGALWHTTLNQAGGTFEFGHPVTNLENKGFLFRNYITVTGEGKQGFGGVSLGDKIVIGGYIPNKTFSISSYGFIQISVGFYSEPEKQFQFYLPLLIGGGFEFQFSTYSAFLVEFGGTFPLIKNDFLKPSPSLTIGYRTYL